MPLYARGVEITGGSAVIEQTIAAATGTVNPYVDVCYVDYTTTGAVTDIELNAAWIASKAMTTFIDVDGNAGTNNITIQNTAGTIQAVVTEDRGSVTVKSDGTNIDIV